ncbi:MAG: PAS domain-containing protein [Myxococcales bacterium]|nr:PAS domain-containing protein [Myxococcales bacterium]
MGGTTQSNTSAILEAILESPRDIVILALDREYRYLAFNDAHRKTIKQIWNVDIHVGLNMVYEVIGRSDDRDRAKRNFDRALAGEHFVVIEEYGDEKLSRRYYENVYSPIIDADGAVIGLTVFLTDITEQKRAQEQLEQYRLRLESLVADRTAALGRSEALYRTLVLNAPVAVIVHRDGKILFVNPAAVTLCAESSEKRLVGRSIVDLVSASVALHAGAAGERPERVEVTLRRRDGTRADVEWTSIAVDFDGAPATFSLAVDVSERKRMEHERRRLEEQMRHTQKLKSLGVLAGGIAHDFNNLLVGILGNADLVIRALALSAIPESARVQLERIKVSAIRAAELTRRMLAYSGKGTFVVRPLDLNGLTREMVDLLNVSLSKSATLVLELAADLPLLEGDATQIRQVVMNLVTNAADAIGDAAGTVTVRTSVIEAGRDLRGALYIADSLVPGSYVCLEVSDTGSGMDEATRSRIFDPFFTTKEKGRGLGLAAVLGIVRSHGGALALETRPGRGSRFRVLFPRAERPVHEPLSAPEMFAWRTTGTVVIADDEPRVREVLRMMLEDIGFRVLEAENAKRCLEVYRAHRDEVSLIMVDLMMPGGGGREVVSTLRADGERVPIVISSGYDERTMSSELRGDALLAFLEKPFDFDTFARTLRSLLDVAQMSRASQTAAAGRSAAQPPV